MKAEVLGSGCATCSSSIALIEEVAKGRAVELSRVGHMRGIVGYGFMGTPAVVVDGRVVHAGGVSSCDEVGQWLAG